MNRVTKRDENGMLFVDGLSWLEVIRALTHAISKLEQCEDACDAPCLVASFMDGDLGPVKYRLIDEARSVWQCEECSHIAQFEANGPISNGWIVCPCCARMIADDSEDVLDEEDDDENQC